jgi:hypothetical protein
MRRTMLSVVAMLVVIFAGPQSFSQDGDGGTYHQDLLNNYYSDNSYSYGVGWDERDCGGYLATGGSATDWRYHQVYSCEGVEMWSSCQEYQPGTGWVNVACPDTGVTAQARVHIPVG